MHAHVEELQSDSVSPDTHMHAVIYQPAHGRISDSLAGKACESDFAIDIHVDIKCVAAQLGTAQQASYGVQESLGGGGVLVLRKCTSAHVAIRPLMHLSQRGNLSEAVYLDYKGCSQIDKYRQDICGVRQSCHRNTYMLEHRSSC